MKIKNIKRKGKKKEGRKREKRCWCFVNGGRGRKIKKCCWYFVWWRRGRERETREEFFQENPPLHRHRLKYYFVKKSSVIKPGLDRPVRLGTRQVFGPVNNENPQVSKPVKSGQNPGSTKNRGKPVDPGFLPFFA